MSGKEGPAEWAARRPWWRDYIPGLIGVSAWCIPNALWGWGAALLTGVIVFSLWMPVAMVGGEWLDDRKRRRYFAKRDRAQGLCTECHNPAHADRRTCVWYRPRWYEPAT